MYQAISSGVDISSLDSFMDIVGKLSVGGVATIKEATDGITNLANAFGVAYGDTEK